MTFLALFMMKTNKSCSPGTGTSPGTCFIQKTYAPSSSLLQGKHLPFSPSPLRINMFPLFVILSLTQLYRYTPEIFLFSTVTFKYTYRAPLRRIGQEYQRTQLVLFLKEGHVITFQIQLINLLYQPAQTILVKLDEINMVPFIILSKTQSFITEQNASYIIYKYII